MAQTTQQSVLDVTGAQFLLDINAILPALFSASSGATAPTVTVPGQFWFDTSVSPGVLKQRNSADTAWLTIGGANLSTLAALTLAQGDLLYATGPGAVTRLPKGTAGQFLTQNAGATAPLWANLFGASSLTFPNGFVRLPGNLHIMWGTFATAGGSTTFNYSTISGAISLAAGSRAVVSSVLNGASTAQENTSGVVSCTTTGFTVYQALNTAVDTFFIAIGA